MPGMIIRPNACSPNMLQCCDMAQATDQGAGRPADGMESVPGGAVQLLHQAIDRLAADDIDHLSDPGLGEELISLRRSIDRLEAEFGRRLRRFDRLRGHVADGATSLVAWLRYRCRLSVSGAVARSQVARFLSGVPTAEDLLRDWLPSCGSACPGG